MKKLLTRQTAATITLFLLLAAGSSSRALAQNPDEGPPPDAPQVNQEGNWIRALNLSPDQVARIRAIREQNKEARQAARQRVVGAQRALDQAIYADEADEAVVEERARDLASAQAAEVRLRATTELSIRRVLTPQQLNLFRVIRMQLIHDAQVKRRLENRQRPNRRLENGVGLRPGGGGQGGVFPRRIRP